MSSTAKAIYSMLKKKYPKVPPLKLRKLALARLAASGKKRQETMEELVKEKKQKQLKKEFFKMILNEQTLREMVLETLEEVQFQEAFNPAQLRDPKGVLDIGWKGFKNLLSKGKFTRVGGRWVGPGGKVVANKLYLWLLRKGITTAGLMTITRAIPAWIFGPWGIAASVAIPIIWSLYNDGSDDPDQIADAMKADGGQKIKDRYQVVVQGPNGEEEKWFKSQKKRREWMACYKKRGGGDINFDVNAPPCGTATADPATTDPTAKPKVAVKKRRGKSSRCAGKGWGRYKMPADVPYKSFKEFYTALFGNTEAQVALGKKDCRWGPKHDAAYKMLSGAGATAKKPCLPGQKRIEDLQGNSFCWPPKERLASTGDESLESFKDDSPFGKVKLPYRPTTHHPLGPTLEEQKYQKLLDRILKENA